MHEYSTLHARKFAIKRSTILCHGTRKKDEIERIVSRFFRQFSMFLKVDDGITGKFSSTSLEGPSRQHRCDELYRSPEQA